MSIKIIKGNRPRKKRKKGPHDIIIKGDPEYSPEYKKYIAIVEKTLLLILGKRGLDPEYFSVSELYNGPNKNRLLEAVYGRISGYELQEGAAHREIKVIPNTYKMDLSKLTCVFNPNTETLTISDGTYTYNYTIDDNSIISENGEYLPKQEYVLTHEEELKRYEEKEAWHREHVRRLNESMQIASKEWYK